MFPSLRSASRRSRPRRRLVIGLALLVVAATALAACRLPIKPQTGASPTSVTGPSTLTAAQLVAWFKAKAPADAVYSASVPIEQLVQIFLEESADENVRGDIAFAQSIIETRYFAYGGQVQPFQNNYAGIGACDPATAASRSRTPAPVCARRSSSCATSRTRAPARGTSRIRS